MMNVTRTQNVGLTDDECDKNTVFRCDRFNECDKKTEFRCDR